MPWVIWDILVPMLATFLIGLATGWLLWRWRRQKGNVAAVNLQAEQSEVVESDDSANIVLIEERDSAVARAEAAETELESLKGQIDLTVMGAESDNTPVQALVSTTSEQNSEQLSAELDAATRELEKEKASKAEVEQSLVDLNTRYKNLSVRLEEAVSEEDGATLKEAAALESNFEKAKETIAEQEAKLKQLEENEQKGKQKFEQEIAIKEAQLKQERSEREEVRLQLAREKLTNEKLASEKLAASNADKSELNSGNSSAVHSRPNKVHHLAGFNAGSGNESTISDSKTGDNAPVTGHRTESTAAVSQTPVSDGSDSSSGNKSTAPSIAPSVQSPAAQSSTMASGVSADRQSSAGSGSAARMSGAVESNAAEELTTEIETEAPIADNVVEDVAVDEDDQQQDNNPANNPDSADSSAETITDKATPVKQNVTSINAASLKSAASAQKKTASGYVPSSWSVPEKAPLKAQRDDLQEIKGVGPVLEKLLHKTGIYYYRQVALLDKKGVMELDSQLPQFSGRIQREKWVQQAKSLHRAKYGSAAK